MIPLRTTARRARLLLLCGTAVATLPLTPVRAAPEAPAAQPERHFDVTEYRVEGNTVLSETEIDRAVYDFLGPGRTAADISHARDALAQLYSDKGYATVSTELPQQRVTDGVVVIRVTERPVGRLRVVGSRYFDLNRIKHGARSVAEGKVPDMNRVQRDIVALNQWPDRTVTPVLRAGAYPGTVDVDLQVQDHLPLHASLELNNQQSIDTTPLRVAGNVTYDNLWQRGDSATFNFQLAPERPNDATVLSTSYLFRIPDSPVSLLGSYLHSNSNVSTVGSTNVLGRGDIAGFRVLVPLPPDEGFVQSLSAGMDYKHFLETISLTGVETGAPVTYYPAVVSYQASWTTPRSETDLTSSILWTFAGLGSNDQQFDYRRYDALSRFVIARADVERSQTIPYGIQLYAHATGEVSPNPVVDNEQFSLGGLYTVRGYLESELLGDEGAAIQTEIRSPALPASSVPHFLDDLRLFGFFDVGGTAIHNPQEGQVQSYTAASTGGGVRVRLFNHLNGEFVAAVALFPGLQTRSGEARGLFRVYGDF
jgi:hemolysin activation/secretion protein